MSNRIMGHQVTVIKDPTEMPSDFMHSVEKTLKRLELFTAEIFYSERDAYFKAEFEIRSVIQKLSRGNEGVRRALAAVFLQGVIEQCEKYVRNDNPDQQRRDRQRLIHMGARLQRHLMVALLQLDQRLRRLVLECPIFFGLNRRRWREQYLGAVSAARVVYWLDELGYQVITPTPEIDITMGIDLLVGEPGQIEGGMCIQVQAGRNKPQMVRYFTSEPTEAELPRNENQKKSCQQIWHGTQRFNKTFGTNWIPVYISSGDDSENLEEIETTTWLGVMVKHGIKDIPARAAA